MLTCLLPCLYARLLSCLLTCLLTCFHNKGWQITHHPKQYGITV